MGLFEAKYKFQKIFLRVSELQEVLLVACSGSSLIPLSFVQNGTD